MGAAIGAFVMLAIFGDRFVLGTSAYWEYPRGDAKIFLSGYQYFVHELWAWPPGMIQSIAPPTGVSLTFTDSVPLLALFAKLVEPIVPNALHATFARPYGMWLLLVFTLQGLMAARVDQRLGGRTLASAALTAAFVCTLPTFLVRFGHEALDAHFYLLWALLLVVIVRNEPPRWQHIGEWSLLVLLVALTHPYLLAMCGALFAAWCVTALRTHRRPVLASVLAAVAAAGALVLFAMSVLGLLHLRTVSGRSYGFGEASFNPVSILVSQFSGLDQLMRQSALAPLFDPKHADATGLQYEGQDYFGIGLMGIVVFAVFTHARALRATIRKHVILVSLFGIFVVFSLSNRVFFGKYLLFSYPWPHLLDAFATQFRSSGRFIWVPTYAVVLWSVASVARQGKGGAGFLAVALLAQLPDLRPLCSWMREVTAGPEAKRLDWQGWDAVLRAHDTVAFYPHHECLTFFHKDEDGPALAELYELSYLAATHHRVVRSFFSPRASRDCPAEVGEHDALVPRDGTVYVMFRRIASGHTLANIEAKGARCLPFGAAYACSTRFREGQAWRLGPPSNYVQGTWISFARQAPNLDQQGPGWSAADENGRWVGSPYQGTRTSFHFATARRGRVAFEIEVDGERGAGPPASIGVAINDRDVGTLTVARGAERERARFCAPGDLPGEGRFVVVDLFARDPKAPSASGVRVRAARLVGEGC
jgi:hypothetical protein